MPIVNFFIAKQFRVKLFRNDYINAGEYCRFRSVDHCVCLIAILECDRCFEVHALSLLSEITISRSMERQPTLKFPQQPCRYDCSLHLRYGKTEKFNFFMKHRHVVQHCALSG